MKIPQCRSLPLFAMVGRCLPRSDKPSPPAADDCQQRQSGRKARGAYTLIEVLAAAAIISIGATAMVSLSATLMLQEELSARVALVRNYQESMVRLWQLGLSPVQVTAVIPSQAQNALLQQAIHGTPELVETGITTVNGVAMETVRCRAVINSSIVDPRIETEGASFTITAYRPRLVTELRIPAP